MHTVTTFPHHSCAFIQKDFEMRDQRSEHTNCLIKSTGVKYPLLELHILDQKLHRI